MKKQFITPLCLLVSTAVLVSCANAQTTALVADKNWDAATTMGYTLAQNDKLPASSTALAYSAVAPKVQRSFEKNFKDANGAQWYALDKNTYLATYTKNDGRNGRAVFAKNGYIYYAIHNGNEQSLSKDNRKIVKTNYVDYNIGKVSEVLVDKQKIYIINLQDDDNLVIARVADGSLEELEHYQTHFTDKKIRKGKIIIP